ncbi:MAG: hypothetical protein R3E68_01075 [Burkholderiaceae bacterium]
MHTSTSADAVLGDAATAVATARAGGRIATLILPADTAWNPSRGPAGAMAVPALPKVDDKRIGQAVQYLRSGKRCTLMMTGPLLVEPYASLAARLAVKTGCRLLAQQSNARMSRGLGHPNIARVPYVVAQARAALADIEVLILLGANPPASFFAYPDQPNMMSPEACDTFVLASRDDDLVANLEALADAVGVDRRSPLVLPEPSLQRVPEGALTADSLM